MARPFFNTDEGLDDARLIGESGVVSGTLDIRTSTEFETLEVLYRESYLRNPCSQVDFVVGYRYAATNDRVRIDESTLSLAGATAGTSFDLFDQFDTNNTFHGAEFGVILTRQANPCWTWEAVAKVALGGSDYRARVSGQTTITDDGDSTTSQGGCSRREPTSAPTAGTT